MISLPDHDWLMRSLWIAFVVVWSAGALVADRTVRRPSRAQYWPHLALMICGVALMLNDFDVPVLRLRLWRGNTLFPLGFILTALGLAIAIWARIHLGRFWSAAVGSKTEHRLIESGPYARLRHPIYTGIILALLGSAIADGGVHAMFGAAMLVAAMVAKSRSEEQWLAREFGPAYGAYRARRWALVPFIY